MTTELVTLAQIARFLGVTAAALSNWQVRYGAEFPSPVKQEGKRRLFALDEVVSFVKERGLADASEKKSADESASDPKYEKRRDLDNFVFKTLGELRNELPIENALLFTAALAVQTMFDRKQIVVSSETEEIARDVMNETEARLSHSDICSSLKKVWDNSAPEMSPSELADSLYRGVLKHARILGNFEHATSESLAELIRKLAPGQRVLNIGSGLGLLARGYSKSGSHVTAQEVNYPNVRFHILLSALTGFQDDILLEDALLAPHPEWRDNPFDVVVSNPPWNAPVHQENINLADPRWRALSEFRSRNILDYFIESAIAYLGQSDEKQTHRAVFCVPPSWLFSEQSNRMRNYLIRNEYIEGVIQLGDGFNIATRLPMAILVLSKKGTPRRAVRMIDAREIGIRENPRRHRNIPKDQINDLVTAFNTELAEDRPNFRVSDVPIEELRTDQVLLMPSRYTARVEPLQSPGDAALSLDSTRRLLLQRIQSVIAEIEKIDGQKLVDLLLPLASNPAPRIKLRGVHKSQMVLVAIRGGKTGPEPATWGLERDDVVVCLGGSSLGKAELGETVINNGISWPRMAILQAVDQRSLNQKFLLIWATFGGLKEYLQNQVISATTPFLGRHALDDVSISIPQLEMQAEIVAWFEPIMNTRRKLRGSVELFERQTVIVAEGKEHSDSIDALITRIIESASVILQSFLGPISGAQS